MRAEILQKLSVQRCIVWLQGDVVGLKARVGETLQQLDAARRLAAASVTGLAEMDAVKQRMEAAASTLKVSQTHTYPAAGHSQ